MTMIGTPARKTGWRASARPWRMPISIAGGRCASCDGSKTAVAAAPPSRACNCCSASADRYLGIDTAMPWVRMVPRIASPIAAPIERDSCVADVATAMSWRSTEFCTIST